MNVYLSDFLQEWEGQKFSFNGDERFSLTAKRRKKEGGE
jgi:hypothetical protein